MAKINDYYQKKQLMEKLSEELRALEQDQTLQQQLKFEDEVRAMMKEYNKSAKDVLQVLKAIDPSIANASTEAAASTRPRRPLRVYKNPHTGEVVETRGGNHKVLNEWRAEHGKDAVQSWLQS
ncbi:histone-like nucleoid-structuring protein, MvaT/MvaU family [Marinobacter sp. X15-166B]|uniref:histone-like nucleoid-structuring protein, MvaT/MvaU family n=1 Tax=Marinobacter sp. X15-166B TaxID=1897620 RepID=UPI00085BC90E|nr:histone-like nucleoid-structuring protein, MvaT/MvaU family [Marinobacter sp. X15-166B]OEY65144.1 H-NS histone [Marinobacter sp. X15-166B]